METTICRLCGADDPFPMWMVSDLDFDIILEIKDKEKSAKKAIEIMNKINLRLKNNS